MFHICFSFEAKQTTHRLRFPSFDYVESFLAPEPILIPKAEHTVDVFHHPSALLSPRHVFASVDLHIFPPDLVCGLHPFFKTLVRLPLTIHGAAEDLEFLFKKEPVTSNLGIN